ncbi:M3 family metallopeptidase, partial [Arthrospira platensis SPKY1]|nr:M3 family metallopeptidase [Arthrospira platensis SPKY1]
DDLGVVAFDRAELEGLSDAQFEQLEREPETGAYTVATGLRPQYELVMRHAARRDTRRRTLAAAQRRALEPNRPLIHEVIELRTQIARLLGYPSWADYRTEPRMAGTAAA